MISGARRVCAAMQMAAIVGGLLIGLSNLVVWIEPRLLPPWGINVMRFNTGLALSLAAASLWCWRVAARWQSGVRWAQLFGAAVALIGGATVAQEIFRVDLHVDEIFCRGTFPGDVANVLTSHPGRMSFNAAMALLFLGLSLAGLDWSVPTQGKQVHLAPRFALIAALPASLGIIGYLLGLGSFTGLLSSTKILLHTALALFLLVVGVLATRPERWPLNAVFATGASGMLLRWMLPGTVSLLLGWGSLIGWGRREGWVAPGEGTALMLFGGLILLFFLLNAASQGIGREERRTLAASRAGQESEERHRAVVDTALDAVMVMDERGVVMDWNPAAERLFGWRQREAIGQPLVTRLIPERLRKGYQKALTRMLEGHEIALIGRRLELHVLRADGVEFPVEASLNRLPGEGRGRFVAFVRNIAERRAADEKLRSAKNAAESALRAKDDFLAALSHELRTPLTPVLMSAAALRQDERLLPAIREQMAMMERNVRLEARLIDDLLDLTRLVRGKLPLQIERCDVHSLIQHALEMVRDEAQAKQVVIAVRLEARKSGLMGDPARLQQVFWNLLKNAVKFTPTSGGIAIRTRDDEQGARRLWVEVSDTGVGFLPQEAEHLFKPFEQGGHKFGGLGLGLAIARAILELHGGKIEATSKGANCGATFVVQLPGATDPPAGLIAHPIRVSSAPAAPAGWRLLVVEDHVPTREVLVQLLKRAGYLVISAGSVDEGLKVSVGQELDAIVSDLGLPDGTGLDLMRKLQELRPGLPGIAVSGYGTEADLQRSREVGFARHLVKPVDFDELRQALEDLKAGEGASG